MQFLRVCSIYMTYSQSSGVASGSSWMWDAGQKWARAELSGAVGAGKSRRLGGLNQIRVWSAGGAPGKTQNGLGEEKHDCRSAGSWGRQKKQIHAVKGAVADRGSGVRTQKTQQGGQQGRHLAGRLGTMDRGVAQGMLATTGAW
jgi:hypothetical protein